MKYKTSRNLSYCNDDQISEYEWHQGKFDIDWHYNKGVILGSEDIKIENIKHPEQ